MTRLLAAAEFAALVAARAVIAVAGRRVQRARWERDVEAWARDLEIAADKWRSVT